VSKLIDKLNQMSKGGSKPIGFRAAPSASTKTKMLLIASLAQAGEVSRLADSLGGADAVLIGKAGSGAKTIQKAAQSLPDIPWGLQLDDLGKEIKPVMEAGCDFIVFPANATLAISEDDGVGKILQVEPSLSEGLLRAINALPVDAVLIASEPGEELRLTWHHLMRFQRFADLLTKPLLASVPLGVTAGELQALWKTGVDGVVVAAEPPVERLKELCQMIDGLTLPSRAGEKVEVLLPRIGGETGTVTEAEEEEEEEE